MLITLILCVAQGRLPPLRQLTALTLAVSKSHELTPQQNEEEVAKRWPPGYKKDRNTAQEYAKDIFTFVTKYASKDYKDLTSQMETFLASLDPNRRQRDLRERGLESVKDFYHDNEHEYRSRGGKSGIWIGNHPPYPGSIFDEESAELSDGELVPKMETLGVFPSVYMP
jgi:hypothetical protein